MQLGSTKQRAFATPCVQTSKETKDEGMNVVIEALFFAIF